MLIEHGLRLPASPQEPRTLVRVESARATGYFMTTARGLGPRRPTTGVIREAASIPLRILTRSLTLA